MEVDMWCASRLWEGMYRGIIVWAIVFAGLMSPGSAFLSFASSLSVELRDISGVLGASCDLSPAVALTAIGSSAS